MTKIKLRDDLVLVQPIESERVTPGGIVLLDSDPGQTPQYGYVIDTGPGKKMQSHQLVAAIKAWLSTTDISDECAIDALSTTAIHIDMQILPGDKILYSKNGYQDVRIDGIDYHMLAQDSVIGVLE